MTDYKISSQIGLSVFDKILAVTAVAYPSVRQLGAASFVVRTEGFWDHWGVSAARYGQARQFGMGFYRFRNNQGIDGIYTDGAFNLISIVNPEITMAFDPLPTFTV